MRWFTPESKPKYEITTCFVCHHFYNYIQILGITYDRRWQVMDGRGLCNVHNSSPGARIIAKNTIPITET